MPLYSTHLQRSLNILSIKTQDRDNLLPVVTTCQEIYLEEAEQSLWKWKNWRMHPLSVLQSSPVR